MLSTGPLSETSGLFMSVEMRLILNAFIPFTTPSMFVNEVPWLATYQTSDQVTPVKFVISTATLGIPEADEGQARNGVMPRLTAAIRSLAGNIGVFPSSSTLTGVDSTSQPGVSA